MLIAYLRYPGNKIVDYVGHVQWRQLELSNRLKTRCSVRNGGKTQKQSVVKATIMNILMKGWGWCSIAGCLSLQEKAE